MVLTDDVPDYTQRKAKQYTQKLIAEHEHCVGPVQDATVGIAPNKNHSFDYVCKIWHESGRSCEHKAIFSNGSDSYPPSKDAQVSDNSEQVKRAANNA